LAEAEVDVELARRGELDGVKAHAEAGADEGEHVVNIDDAGGWSARGVDGGLIDFWLGLAGSDAAGIDAGGKVAKESEVGFDMRDMERICVGEKDEAATAREAREKMIRENRAGEDDAGPGLAELVKCDTKFEAAGEVRAPIARGEAALLPVFPEMIALNGGPDFFRGFHFIRVEDGQDAARVNTDVDATDVENDGCGWEGAGHGGFREGRLLQREGE
jgi:hypothetical protein